MKSPHLQLTAGLLLASAACAGRAVIAKRGGERLVARIDSSQEESLLLIQRNGKSLRVERAAICDIDHPGNVVAIVGGAILGLGVAAIVDGLMASDPMGENVIRLTYVPA